VVLAVPLIGGHGFPEIPEQIVGHRFQRASLARIALGRQPAIIFNAQQHQPRLVPLRDGHGPAQRFRDDVSRLPREIAGGIFGHRASSIAVIYSNAANYASGHAA
jgi:hypothetical protein